MVYYIYIDEVDEHANQKCAFVSTPSLYFSVPLEKRKGHLLLDIDEDFGRKDKENGGFLRYDFNHPCEIPLKIQHSFSMVVIDPPFITKEVWENYTETAKLLLTENGKILLSTIPENQDMMLDLLNCKPQNFRPSIPHLVYQYALYTNYESTLLQQKNSEIEEL